MSSTLTTMLADLRDALKDIDATDYRWTDAELTTHLERALAEYSRAAPLLASLDDTADAVPLYDLSATTGWLWLWRAEYPIDEHPRSFLKYEEPVTGKVYLLEETLPNDGDALRWWYAKTHTLSAATSTIPVLDEPIVLCGAEAFAYLAQGNYTIGRVNPNPDDAVNYRTLGLARLASFREKLDALLAHSGGPPAILSWAPTASDV